MLKSITIRHVALIDECTIEFHDGLQVLTGETGAGKSIVVDSVSLILGGRADRELIRSGCEKATVEAVFEIPDNQRIQRFMKEEEIDFDGQSLSIYREISQNGRNTCRVCGVPVPVSKLKELASYLMDMHGQSEHQFLADPEMHLSFLDQTGSSEHRKLIEDIKAAYESFISNHRAYAKLVRQSEKREARMAVLKTEMEQIRKANLRPGEAMLLQEELKKLKSAEKESHVLRTAEQCISGEDAAESSSLSRIRNAAEALKVLAGQNSNVREISERCSALYYELEEIAYEISTLLNKTDSDPVRLEKVEHRLDTIRQLEHRYGTDADDLTHILEKMQAEYDELDEAEERISRMSKEHKQLLAQYRNTARELTESRKQLAETFEERITKELQDLGMGNTRFEVLFRKNESGKPLMPKETGDDQVEFMISPNPGEPLKPLARIASGGELSRLMLAVKTLEASHTGVESMVFDEIDTGISGRMAQVVAEKMIAVSGRHQVICVTHLPQIAAAADYQYLVRKSVEGDRTNTLVTEQNYEGRQREIARMISGAEGINEEATRYADGMLKAARDLKTSTKR